MKLELKWYWDMEKKKPAQARLRQVANLRIWVSWGGNEPRGGQRIGAVFCDEDLVADSEGECMAKWLEHKISTCP